MIQNPPRRRFGLRLIFFLMLVIGVAIWLGGRELPVEIDDGSTLLIGVSGDYVEAPAPTVISKLVGGEGRTFLSLLSLLRRAELDSRIDTVILHIRPLAIGWGKADEIRGAIARLRASDRKVIAYLEVESFSVSREFYIATAADEIQVVPGSVTPLVGLAAEYLYYGGLWEKIGVEIQSTKAGKYKSAVETIAGEEMSEATREMMDSLLDGQERRFVEAIAEGRGVSPDEVREIIDRGLVNPEELLEVGMIDGIRHFDEIPETADKLVRASQYAGVTLESLGIEEDVRLALIYGTGSVVTGKAKRSPGGGPVFAAESIREALKDAADDSEVAGIILRLDSPGGSPMASELIWDAVRSARESGKPVVASVSDVAASGAYYVASAADAIVISPGALTGSIGVFALRPNFEDLLEKLDIGVETLTRGRYSDFNFSMTQLSPGARDRMERITEEIYRKFTGRVAEGRGLSVEQVHEVGQGRVWSGDQAVELGLVDELGGLRESVVAMLRLLEMDEDSDASLILYPPAPTLAQEIAGLIETRSIAIEDALPMPAGLRAASGWIRDLPLDGPLLIQPVLVNIR